MKIKVCGMKDKENIEALEKVREVDFMGHIFTEKSPRFIGGNQVKSHISSFGVFVNSSKSEIEKAVLDYDLSYIQLHGDESPAFSRSINESVKPVVKVFAISNKQEYKGKTPFFLSGGISVDDAQAIKEIQHPLLFGVDINSRFEVKPGIKNIEEIKTFAKQLKS